MRHVVTTVVVSVEKVAAALVAVTVMAVLWASHPSGCVITTVGSAGQP
jgi:hypothetical protein